MGLGCTGWKVLDGIRTKCGTLQKAGGALSAGPRMLLPPQVLGHSSAMAQGSSVPAVPHNMDPGDRDVAAGSCQRPVSWGAGMG